MTKRIIAIGGGELKDLETFAIDTYIVSCAEKPSPKLLFIPTASFDAQGYVETVEAIYGERLGCEVSALLLMSEGMTKEKAEMAIAYADIIYVGGGSTSNLLQYWEKFNLKQALKTAYERGVPLCGLSAGSICWFEYGHSDSITYETGEKSPYICLEALGFLPGVHCPHHNEGRELDFDQMIYDMDQVGIALENCAAIEVVEDTFRILKSQPEAQAFKVYRQGEQVIREPLENTETYLPLTRLNSAYK